ncbi:MAG: restriction endonuclease subunit S [Bryobacteraceae bacterium]
MSDVPDGWARPSLQDVTVAIRDGTHTPPKRVAEGVPLLSARNIQDGRIDWSELYSFIERDDYLEIARTNPVCRGDVLVTIVGSLGRSCVNDSSLPFTLQRSVAILRPEACLIDPHYLSFALRSPEIQERMQAEAGGTAQKGVYLGNLKKFTLPLAPLTEQRRIVAKLDALLARVDACRQHLDKIPKLLARFRQSVLAAACSGRLTVDWRVENTPIESAARMVERVERLAQGGRRTTTKARDERGEFDEDLPKTWTTAAVDQLSTAVADGVHKTPQYVDHGIPFLTVRNLTAGPGISFREHKWITAEDHELFTKRTKPEKGDILVTKDGTLGVVRLIETSREFSIFVSLALIKPASGSISRYLALALTFPQVHSRIVFTGSGLQHIHLRDLRAVVVPIPPEAEQHEIVRRVDQLFTFADRLEARVQTARKRVDALTQSILAKAFRGELVPTEAELAEAEGRPFESAEQLLNRIRSERETTPTPRKRTRAARAQSLAPQPGR